jgi:hypothetical protein
MRREFCYFPDEFTEALINFGNANKAWCYINIGPGSYKSIELSTLKVIDLIDEESISDISIFLGFKSIVPYPIWNEEREFVSLDMISSYAINFQIPQFNRNKSILSFGYMATFDKNRFESSDLATKLMKLCNEFSKILSKSRTRKYAVHSVDVPYIWKDIWVSENVSKHAGQLMFSQLLKVHPEAAGDYRLVKLFL